MYDLNSTENPVIDTLSIEAEARRMRAQIIATGLRAFASRISALLAASPATKAQH